MKFKVAAVQITRTPNRDGNLAKTLKFTRAAAAKGAKFVCIPEMFYSGIPRRKTERGRYAKAANALSEAAKELRIYIVAGISEAGSNGMFNSAFIFSPRGDLVGKYRKLHLFPLKPIKETGVFKHGNVLGFFKTGFCKIGVIICYDLRFPEETRKLAKLGAEILFIPAAWPIERIEHWKALARARGIENQYFVVGANRCGNEVACEMGGNSIISDYRGKIMKSMDHKKEGYIIGEIDLDALKKYRKRLPCLKE